MRREQEKCLKRLLLTERKLGEELQGDQISIAIEIENISRRLEEYMQESELERLDKVSYDISVLSEGISSTLVQADVINRRETILNWKPTDFKELEKIKEQFTPYERVWGLAKQYQITIPNIMKGPLSSLNREQIMQEIQEAWSDLLALEKNEFKVVTHMLELTRQVRRQYESFKPYIPLINDLRNPDLRTRHWKKLSEITAIAEFEDGSEVTLETCLARGIERHKEEIRDISEIASRELDFEKVLNRMKRDWKEIKFRLHEYPEAETWVIKDVEKVLEKLDEDTVRTQVIISSPFIKFLENEVLNWRNQYLFRAIETIELWMKVQKNWLYLQPIFSSPDIMEELPKEGGKFNSVEKMWKSIMAQTRAQPNVMECAQGKFRDSFIMMIEQLDSLLKSLNDYLNGKRLAFPRFYFLSNEELLEIFSKARIVTSVQKHLPKCFEGINLLTFSEGNGRALAINSFDGERIELRAPVPAMEDGKARPVEVWLNELDQASKASLAELLLSRLPDCPKDCGQLTHLHEMLTWTGKAEKALGERGGLPALVA